MAQNRRAPARPALAHAPFVLFVAIVLALVGLGRRAEAAVETRLLRIDPRAGVNEGTPVLTSVVELVQFSSLSEVVSNAGCGVLKGDALLACISTAVEKPGAIAKPFPFPDAQARLMVRVDGGENLATFAGKTAWGQSKKDPLVGTAWLIALDASSMMGARYQDAREVANQFIGSMGPNDIAKLIIFDDKLNAYRANTEVGHREGEVEAHRRARRQPRSLALAAAAGAALRRSSEEHHVKAFGDLGNSGSIQNIPMMQAMVLLSNGAGRKDAGVAARAEVMKQYFNNGRFPEDNTAAPKTPLPVISIFFPKRAEASNKALRRTTSSSCRISSNPEIGGFFDIVQAGQSVEKARTIVSLVKKRFDEHVGRQVEALVPRAHGRAVVQPRLPEHEASDQAGPARSRTCPSA
jgi:hypothetical protein